MTSKPEKGRSALSVEEAIVGRRSIRAFRPDPVPRETVERILEIAARAPSGSNVQPWHVHVLTGEAKEGLSRELVEAHAAGEPHEAEYQYYPVEWYEPYISRRRKVGWGLYGLLGIERGEKEKMAAQHARNYLFFDAPVGLIFTIDRKLSLGSWLDYGMFLQNIMVAARHFGLETCPQQAFARYHTILQRRLSIPPERMVICGMALGYADWNAVENRLETERSPVSDFAVFVDRLSD